jgi:hypothetical protein
MIAYSNLNLYFPFRKTHPLFGVQPQPNQTQPLLQLRYELELGLGLLGNWARKLLEIYYAGSKVDINSLERGSRRPVVRTPAFTPIGGNLRRVHIHIDFATLKYMNILEHLPLREWLDPLVAGWEDCKYNHGWMSYEDCKWHHEVWDSAERRWTYDGRVSKDGTRHRHKVWDSDWERWTSEDPGKVWNSVKQRCSSVTSATDMMRDFLFLQELQDELIMYTYQEFNSWPCPSETGHIGRLWDQWYPCTYSSNTI